MWVPFQRFQLPSFFEAELMKALTVQKLTNKNITPTAMRMLVLDFLLKQKSAISLSDIEKGLAPADRITIYRTIKTFEEKGLAHAIDDGTGSPKYALCADECDADHHYDMHVHFYCIHCGETICLPDSKIPQITLPMSFRSLEMNLTVKGVCDKCTK
jgi:Fur family ferric uptake transcriptional regulator